MNNREREVTNSNDTDVNLNYATTKLVGKFETAMSGLKTGVEHGMFRSEIGSGIGEPGGTPYQEFQRIPPSPRLTSGYRPLCHSRSNTPRASSAMTHTSPPLRCYSKFGVRMARRPGRAAVQPGSLLMIRDQGVTKKKTLKLFLLSSF